MATMPGDPGYVPYGFAEYLAQLMQGPLGQSLLALVAPTPFTPALGLAPTPIPPAVPISVEDDTKWVGKDFLLYAALIAGGLVAAPVVYRAAMASSRGKRAAANDLIAQELGNASNRGVALLAAVGPAIGFPIAYIGVQCLESRGIITRGLGNAVQTLMATAAAGQAASGIGSLLSSVVKAVKV